MMEDIPISGDDDLGDDQLIEYGDFESADRNDDSWSPMGCRQSPDVIPPEIERLRALEDEQETLNSSLLALTTHFAQVQFRLQQIGMAESAEKDHLLKELEEFAFRGCPDVLSVQKETKQRRMSVRVEDSGRDRLSSDTEFTKEEHKVIVQQQRAKQLQLIGQLRDQLEDLEKFAYESGEGELPSGQLMEKQRVLIDQLRHRIDLDLDGFDRLSPDELQRQVDTAIKRLINPIKAKDQLVQQLTTQIADLERFVEYLQVEGASGRPCSCDKDKSTCPAHSVTAMDVAKAKALGYNKPSSSNAMGETGQMQDVLTLMQLYILSNLGCQSNHSKGFQSNELKSSSRGCHWGDLRAALELAVDKLVDVTMHNDGPRRQIPSTRQSSIGSMIHDNNNEASKNQNVSYNSDEDEEDDIFDNCSEEVVMAVRRYFCPALRDLLQHGLVTSFSYSSGFGLGFGCIPTRRRQKPITTEPKSTKEQQLPVHAWDVIFKYYEMKHGREFSEAPVRKLSQSFNLDNIGGRSVTSRQMLLCCIDSICVSHSKLKRSSDAMFKAFVCAALNKRKLVPWLRMILRTREIVEENYEPWSYVTKTGFEDAFELLEKLAKFQYALPVDLAVRPFKQIKDAF